MTYTAAALCRITSAEETAFGDLPEGPRLTRGNFILAYRGDLEGEGILEELKVEFPGKRAVMSGLQRVSGRLGEFTGSFVLKSEAKSINGRMTSRQTVVPGSGTGALKGLRGEFHLETQPAGEFSVTFHYRFA